MDILWVWSTGLLRHRDRHYFNLIRWTNIITVKFIRLNSIMRRWNKLSALFLRGSAEDLV